jgi:hypothetical protein
MIGGTGGNVNLGRLLVYNISMDRRKNPQGILILKKADEDREIEFEVGYLRSLTPRQRFTLMQRKSREMRALLRRHGHGTTPSISKRK